MRDLRFRRRINSKTDRHILIEERGIRQKCTGKFDISNTDEN
jgi:hypothetical protein